MCLSVSYYTDKKPANLTDEDICCSLDHQERYTKALWSLYGLMWEWYRCQHLPFVGSGKQIEHYFRHDGGLNTVGKPGWRGYQD